MTATAARTADVRCAGWVGSLPLIFGVVTLLSMIVAGVLGLDAPAMLADWWLYGVFGSVVFLPVTVVSWVGAGALDTHFTAGRWVVTIASAADTALCAWTVYGMFELLLGTQLRSPESWLSAPTAGGTVLFTIPYLVITAANAYLVVRLWRRG